jgi:hypothetical protein
MHDCIAEVYVSLLLMLLLQGKHVIICLNHLNQVIRRLKNPFLEKEFLIRFYHKYVASLSKWECHNCWGAQHELETRVLNQGIVEEMLKR